MLKELLTNSRKTVMISTNENNSMVRKSSHSSITSMASLKQSNQKSKLDITERTRKQSELLLSSYETNVLKDLVKSKM